jgi:transcriptional regulator with GAF, ATPase, and Fis domain
MSAGHIGNLPSPCESERFDAGFRPPCFWSVKEPQQKTVVFGEFDKASTFEGVVGASPALREVLAQISRVARTDSTVLIAGETGTGKELVARAIHRRSRRSTRDLVRANCAAFPSTLVASELFGHEKGAFTDAVCRRLGRFELAEGGTIFLDEIGEVPAETQIALLRVLQERVFERVGGVRPLRADVRVIAATNRDLTEAVAEGSFRADLFYRLNVFPIEVPPLRDRREDIPLLVAHFARRYASRAGKNITAIASDSLNLLESYDWPGNIRELQNIVDRAVIVCDSGTLTIRERWLSGRLRAARDSAASNGFARTAVEKTAIEAALMESKGRVDGPFGAAGRLGVPRTTLESRIRTLGIDKRRFKAA